MAFSNSLQLQQSVIIKASCYGKKLRIVHVRCCPTVMVPVAVLELDLMQSPEKPIKSVLEPGISTMLKEPGPSVTD